METIKNYLDNMFAGLPKTVQMADLKNNILSNMEDKYNELKAAGKSENEAIGIVISEFGNIEELTSELGIHKETENDSRPVVSQEETTAYLSEKKIMGLKIGFGVILCILAPASLILVNQLMDDGYIGARFSENTRGVIGLIPLFLLVAAAVGLFIYSGLKFEKYKYMEEGVQLPVSVKQKLQQLYDGFAPTFNLTLILGVCMLILSPISLFIGSLMGGKASNYGVVILLAIVAVAVFLFIYFGSIREGYCRLLQIGDYTEKKMTESKKEDKVIGAVASIVWPLAVLIFLFCGFVFHLWTIAWIVFPIMGILFGMFSAAYSIITGKNA
jgi:hypothetical protein